MKNKQKLASCHQTIKKNEWQSCRSRFSTYDFLLLNKSLLAVENVL
jgi:hypothetical protein